MSQSRKFSSAASRRAVIDAPDLGDPLKTVPEFGLIAVIRDLTRTKFQKENGPEINVLRPVP
jgi:hypothetical protein